MAAWESFRGWDHRAQVILAIYVFMALVTAGHFWRRGRKQLSRRFLHLVAAVLWPLYWLFALGVIGTVDVLVKSLITLVAIFYTAIESVIGGLFRLLAVIIASCERPAIALWSVGLVFFPAYYLAVEWNTCSTPWCGYVIGKALIWAPFWPVFFLTKLAGTG